VRKVLYCYFDSDYAYGHVNYQQCVAALKMYLSCVCLLLLLLILHDVSSHCSHFFCTTHRFIFSVETNGSINAEDVVVQALDVLSVKLQQLRNELINIKQDA
jgi:RNA polymerase Rpb3/Rpb11 dimerisation domain